MGVFEKGGRATMEKGGRATMDIYTVDAFTDKPFAGNPAAVCVLRGDQVALDRRVMQAIAAEMNISETAFVST